MITTQQLPSFNKIKQAVLFHFYFHRLIQINSKIHRTIVKIIQHMYLT